jgi:hypothetical protein
MTRQGFHSEMAREGALAFAIRRIFNFGHGTNLMRRDSLDHFKASAEAGRKTNAEVG